MSEKLVYRIKDTLASIFGENSWVVTNWLTEQFSEHNPLSDKQDTEVLKKILDGFEGKLSIDNPAFLKIINAWAGVEVKGSIPDLDGLNFVIGNYAGREAQSPESPAFLNPTLWSLFRFFEEVLAKTDSSVYAVARDSVFQGLDSRVKSATEDHMLYAVKQEDGKYTLKSRWGKFTLMRMVRSGKGILWTAPAGSTQMGGLPLEGLTTTSVRQAMEIESAKLLTLTMETDKSGEKAKSIRLDQVDLPTAMQVNKTISKVDYKQLMREVYFQVLLFSFAQVAGHLPEGQRGQFVDPELAKKRVVRNITGINAEGNVRVSGGFMS